MTDSPWLVPALMTACLLLLGFLLKLHLQDRQQNTAEHVALGKRIDSAKNEVKKGLEVEIKELAATVDAFTGVVRELTGYLRGLKGGRSSGGRDGGPQD